MHNPTASQVERLIECPASQALPHVRSKSRPAEEGTSTHQYLYNVGTGMDRDVALSLVDDGRAHEIATELEVDTLPIGANFAQELAMAYDVSTGDARELGRGLSREEAYASLRPFEVGGTSDITGVASDHVFVGDLKTGRSDKTPAQKHWQLRTLAVMAAKLFERHTAKVALFHSPDIGPTWQSRATFDMLELRAFEGELKRLGGRVIKAQSEVAAGKGQFTTGDHCRWCPARAACPAQTTLIRRLVDGEVSQELRAYRPLTPESAGQAYLQLKTIQKTLKEYEKQVYAFAKDNGPLPLGDGRAFGFLISDGNESVDASIATEVLTELYSEDVATTAIVPTTTKTAIKNAIKPLIERGKYAAAERALYAVLKARGALHRKKSARFQVWELSAEEPVDEPPAMPLPDPGEAIDAHIADEVAAIRAALASGNVSQEVRVRIHRLPGDERARLAPEFDAARERVSA